MLNQPQQQNQQQQQNKQQQNKQPQNQQQQGRKQKGTKKQQPKQPQNKDCNCKRGIQNCPLKGKCMKANDVVYVAKVLRLDNFELETYTGVHAGNFKGMLYGHNTNMNNRHHTGTTLSKYVWKL